MNYLAHLFLAGEDPQWQLGGLLGDHVRGRDWQAYPPSVAAGILLHRAIDRTTDSHSVVVLERASLPAKFRRYGGIILDIVFDHFLARQWAEHHQQPLPEFAAGVYDLLRRQRSQLPESMARFAHYLERHNLLVNYADPDYVAMVFSGVSKRLKRTNPLADAGRILSDREANLQSAFDQLLPDLRSFALGYRDCAIARVRDSGRQAEIDN